jgi:hypothetical protein
MGRYSFDTLVSRKSCFAGEAIQSRLHIPALLCSSRKVLWKNPEISSNRHQKPLKEHESTGLKMPPKKAQPTHPRKRKAPPTESTTTRPRRSTRRPKSPDLPQIPTNRSVEAWLCYIGSKENVYDLFYPDATRRNRYVLTPGGTKYRRLESYSYAEPGEVVLVDSIHASLRSDAEFKEFFPTHFKAPDGVLWKVPKVIDQGFRKVNYAGPYPQPQSKMAREEDGNPLVTPDRIPRPDELNFREVRRVMSEFSKKVEFAVPYPHSQGKMVKEEDGNSLVSPDFTSRADEMSFREVNRVTFDGFRKVEYAGPYPHPQSRKAGVEDGNPLVSPTRIPREDEMNTRELERGMPVTLQKWEVGGDQLGWASEEQDSMTPFFDGLRRAYGTTMVP